MLCFMVSNWKVLFCTFRAILSYGELATRTSLRWHENAPQYGSCGNKVCVSLLATAVAPHPHHVGASHGSETPPFPSKAFGM